MKNPRVAAITLDFYRTLVRHRAGRGRGACFMDFLAERGWPSAAWEHRVLYDVFARHHLDYPAADDGEARRRYRRQFAHRVFHRLQVEAPPGAADHHAEDIWSILGPASLEVYEDVPDALRRLRALGYPLAIISNWQCGLASFAAELGIGSAFDHIVASAEIGVAKPDARIFLEAARRLGVTPPHIVHVGDSPVDDVEGAQRAGLGTLHLKRDAISDLRHGPTIGSLTDIANRLP